ncbi:MAG: sigma 54-interacting transcriptional regulator [Candidatus Rokuibacteriota bacterium]
MIGRSPGLRELLGRIEMAAPTEATVLIRGERGTGKELVANAIRDGSRRRTGPFIKVNCAALPGELLASELFGHERGAFTGAHDRQEGLLAAAQGGTLFLDEIGDLSSAGQAMLLRFLQEREVRPIGARRASRVDVRVIAATNRELAGARGEFRADLYDRLREVVVEVPPLRDRREDIPLLIEHILDVASVRHRRPRPTLGPEARRALLRYDWPGNVRELEQTLSSAVVFASADPIQAWQLFPSLRVPVEGYWQSCEPARSIWPTDNAPSLPEMRHSGPIKTRQRAALEFALGSGAVRPLDLMRRFSVSRETARQDLGVLVASGFLQRIGAGRGVRYVRPGSRSSRQGP